MVASIKQKKYSCLVRKFIKNASTSVFNTTKWTHFVYQLSHKYSPKCTIWHIKFPSLRNGTTPPAPTPQAATFVVPNVEHKSAPMPILC